MLVAQGHAHHGASFVRTGFFEVESGTYSIVYFNHFRPAPPGGNQVVVDTSDFTPNGESTGTWVYASAFKDYVIQADTSNVRLKAVVRQVPGPITASDDPWAINNIAWSKNLVLIQSWAEPVDVAKLVLDRDLDGIEDEVDTQPDSPADAPSDNFTDVPLGGVTSGTIDDRAALTVHVRDLNDPDAGLLIWATGAGNAIAGVTICPIEIKFILTIGDVVIATCGSLTAQIIAGEIEAPLTSEHTAILTEGSITRFTESATGIIDVANVFGSEADVVVEQGDNTVSLQPGEIVDLQEGL